MFPFVLVFECHATVSRTPRADFPAQNKGPPPPSRCLCRGLSSSSTRHPSTGKLRALHSARSCDPSPLPARDPDCADRPESSRYVASPPIQRAASSSLHQRTCKLHLRSCCPQKSY